MPIQEDNIKFLESQVMDDVDNGGGAATNIEIIDGEMNNVFDDISDLDRAYGRFNLRKIFLAVRTLSTDLYGGAKTCITALPTDPAISYTLFSRDNPFDTRVDAANQVESYLHKSIDWHGVMMGNHLANMRTVTTFQRVGSRLPPIGKTLCIVQDEGLSTEKEQYVRVIDLDVEKTTFEYITSSGGVGHFDRWVATLTLSDPLRYDFTGHQPSVVHSFSYDGKARIRDTYVVDAAVYYGSQPLRDAAAIGDSQVRAESIYTQLVPSAETETPHIDQVINPDNTLTLDAGTRDVEVPQQSQTHQIEVTAENRRSTWVETIAPIPSPGTLTISYMAQGNWYDLQDDGAGGIAGADPMLGAGTVDYTTGTVYVTLGELPDADSRILMVWATPVHYFVRSGATADNDDALEFSLSLGADDVSVRPGSVLIDYLVGGVQVTASDAAVFGEISGSGVSGTVEYSTGNILLRFTAPPDRNTYLNVNYDRGTLPPTFGTSVPVVGGTIQLSGDGPWAASGSGTLLYKGQYGHQISAKFIIDSDASVKVLTGRSGQGDVRYAWSATTVGTFDTQTGLITLTSGLPITMTYYSRETLSGGFFVGWKTTTDEQSAFQANTVIVQLANDTSGGAYTHAVAVDQLRLKLLTTTADKIVPDSIEFQAAGKTYQDRAGLLYADIDPVTGDGTPAGDVDYEEATALITWWGDNQPANISVDSLLVQFGDWAPVEAFFRTAAAPLKPEALQLVCTTVDGEQLTAVGDAGGNFTHEWIQGTVNYDLGAADLTFGKLVDDSTLTDEQKAEPWYDPADVVGGMIYQPRPVYPSTLRYNAVSYSYLPLDADILGIEPVRLPANGKVPIFRRGNVVLAMHTDDTAPQTIASGETISCGRTRIGWVRLLDANGETITDGYELDRENGIVTVPDVTGMIQPLTVRHTVADLRVATDVQITGHVDLSRPLSHDFPAGESLIASCLIHGDRRARVLDVWDQASWDGSWSDAHGTDAAGTLNLIDYPITVTNEGCDTDRWALRWLSSTTVELLSEKRGKIWSGDYIPGGADIAPINPRTRESDGSGGTPYMTIPGAANGGGWSAGNVLRINTDGAISDIWIARAINQSDEPLDEGADGCELYALGNIDRP